MSSIASPRDLVDTCKLGDGLENGRAARTPWDFHLWRDGRLAYQQLLVSDVLYRKIADMRYKAFDLGVAEEV
jgi:hypothetical protein